MPLTPEERRLRANAASRRYKERHKTETAQRHKEWVERNREQLKAYRRSRYHADPESARAEARTRRQTPQAKATYANYLKTNAARIALVKRLWHAANRDTNNARSSLYRMAHLEAVRALQRAYRLAHPEKAREREAARRAWKHGAAINDLSLAQWEEVKAAKGFRCDYCGKRTPALTRDHVTPLNAHGDHTLWNIVAACASCNSKKGPRPPLGPVQPLLLTIAPRRRKYRRRKRE
jgi:5-methylcytosine-specific restriction endonuclease McrA